MSDPYEFIRYESIGDGAVTRIVLNRPEVRNAQNRALLVELDAALRQAERDDSVRVVILSGAGALFSSGHDLGSPVALRERDPGPEQHTTWAGDGGTRLGAEKRMLQEWHYFFRNTIRWRDLRKITIAQVHGPVYAAGLMLAWACDLIVASDQTVFADVVGTRLGMCGVEYFAHPWELGPRRAKELLLTGDTISAQEAYDLGMVNKIFPQSDIADLTERFAARIARTPTMTSLLIKEAVNQTVDNMGFYNALNACFSLHQVNHAHWAEVTGGVSASGTPEFGVPDRWSMPTVLARRSDAAD